jgi:hypothetical protein
MESAAIRIASRIGSALSPPVRAGPGIGTSGWVTAWRGLVQFGSVVRTITVTACPRWAPSPPEAIPPSGRSLTPSAAGRLRLRGRCAALRSSRVSARAAVGALAAQRQAAAAGPVFFVEIPVGVEDLIDTPGRGRNDVGIVFGRLAHQAALHLIAQLITRR